MPAGRPRKPTAVKRLQGTLEKSRLMPNEPVPQHALSQVQPPEYLSDKAKDIWLFALSQAPEELLTSLDFAIFAVWADTFAKIVECEEVIKRDGAFIIDDKGSCKPNPALRVQNELKSIMRSYIQELGFSPASRSRISIKKDEKKDTNPFLNL